MVIQATGQSMSLQNMFIGVQMPSDCSVRLNKFLGHYADRVQNISEMKLMNYYLFMALH